MSVVTLLLLLLVGWASSLTLVVALDNGMGRTPPLGWSSWCGEGPCGNDYCHEHEVKQVATAMKANGLYQAGYHWIILDDCWAAGNRTENGTLTWDTSRFPSGMPALTEWLHYAGFNFGLYTSAGNRTCSSGGRPYPIPGSEHHYAQDADTFASWDIDYVKIDWCGDVHKLPLDGIQVGAKDYIDFSSALVTSTPRKPMYVEGVAAYIFLLDKVSQFVNAWRASTDHHDDWKNLLEVVDTVELVGKAGAPGAWSYMDVLMTGGEGCQRGSQAHCPKMTDDEYISEFSLWTMYQSPLVVATDVRNMTAVMTKALLNAKLLAIHQDTMTPPGRRIGGAEKHCGWLFEAEVCPFFVRQMFDGSVVLAMFNSDNAAHTITFEFRKFAKHLPAGWSDTAATTVDDLWTPVGTPNTTTTGSVQAHIRAHATHVVRLWQQ